MAAKKKTNSKITPKARVRKKHRRATRLQTWVACGFDTSMSSLAGAAVGYDNTLGKLVGPVFTERRWLSEIHYFDRLKDSAKSYDLVHELIEQLGMTPELDEIYIAQEEPFPSGMAGRMHSNALKQQAEISGAFLGGLVRYGYSQIFQISNVWWRQIIARDLGITIHHSKWRDPKLALAYNCKPADSGKFRSKQWAAPESFQYRFANITSLEFYPNEIPEWPDIIDGRGHGRIPRPENSTAKAIQPDDRYDALAVMQWMVEELERGLQKPEPQALRKTAKLSQG